MAHAALLVALVLACLGGSGCGGGEEERTSSVRLAIGEPLSLMPGETEKSNGLAVLSGLFSGLTTVDERGMTQLSAASAITSRDQVHWTITLKEGMTFHDGSPVTADSFIGAWNWVAYGPNLQSNGAFLARVVGYPALQGRKPKVRALRGLRRIDEQRFTVQLVRPFSQFPTLASYSAFFPMPAAFFADKDPKKSRFREAPVGNGPYRMDGAWRHQRGIAVKPFERYSIGARAVRPIEFVIYQSPAAAFAGYRSKQVDLLLQLPAEQLLSVEKSRRTDTIRSGRPASISYLTVPLYDSRFKDPRIVRGLSMAIDRATIVRTLFGSTATPATSLIAPASPGRVPNACSACKFDRKGARALIAQAGGIDGDLNLWYNAVLGQEPWMKSVAASIQQALGITVNLLAKPGIPEYLKAATGMTFSGPFGLTWAPDYLAPDDYLRPIYGRAQPSNWSGFADQHFEALIDKADSTPVPASYRLYQQAERAVLDRMASIPLWYLTNVGLANKYAVSNAKIDWRGLVVLADLR